MSVENSGLSAVVEGVKSIPAAIRAKSKEVWDDCYANAQEVKHELTPDFSVDRKGPLLTFLGSWVHVPFFPAFHRPGWLLRYLLGPFDGQWLESIFADIWAGILVLWASL